MSLPGSLSSVFIFARNCSTHLKLNADIQSIIIYFAYLVNHFSISKTDHDYKFGSYYKKQISSKINPYRGKFNFFYGSLSVVLWTFNLIYYFCMHYDNSTCTRSKLKNPPTVNLLYVSNAKPSATGVIWYTNLNI